MKLLLIPLLFFSFTLFAQENKDLDLNLVETGNDKWKLYIKNLRLTPQEIVIYLDSTDELVMNFSLPISSDTTIMNLVGDDRAQIAEAFNAKYEIKNFFGDSSTIHPDYDYLYQLPYKKRKKYEVSQGFHGKTSHQSVISEYAIDFRMDIGETVCAAREGTVVKILDHFKESGNKSYVHKANKIIILHEDGTLGTYAHLKYKGVIVNVGDHVERGQEIGYSGNTGYTNGPHLHFVVRKERDIAIPIKFEGYEDINLKRGRRYKCQ